MNDEGPYPFQAHLGFELADWSDGFALLHQQVLPHLGNRHGIPHGGAIATLLDTCMGYAGCWTGDETRQLCLTLSMTVNYIGQARGKMLFAEGRKTGGGRRTFFAQGVVTDDAGVKIATATGAFRYISK